MIHLDTENFLHRVTKKVPLSGEKYETVRCLCEQNRIKRTFMKSLSEKEAPRLMLGVSFGSQ